MRGTSLRRGVHARAVPVANAVDRRHMIGVNEGAFPGDCPGAAVQAMAPLRSSREGSTAVAFEGNLASLHATPMLGM